MSFETSLVWADPGFLCFGERPGLWRRQEQDLKILHDHGVRAIVSLVEDQRIGPYLQSGFVATAIPLRDFQAPSQAQMDFCTQVLQDLFLAGTPVYVHCHAGVGRSGTMAAAWLIRRGLPAAEAVSRIRSVKPGAVETDSQYNALLEFAARQPDGGAAPER